MIPISLAAAVVLLAYWFLSDAIKDTACRDNLGPPPLTYIIIFLSVFVLSELITYHAYVETPTVLEYKKAIMLTPVGDGPNVLVKDPGGDAGRSFRYYVIEKDGGVIEKAASSDTKVYFDAEDEPYICRFNTVAQPNLKMSIFSLIEDEDFERLEIHVPKGTPIVSFPAILQPAPDKG